MKRLTKKVVFILMSLLMVSAIFPANAFAADKTMNLTLRIEGINENVFYDSVEVPYTDTLTLQEALAFVDSEDDSISITGIDAAYITDVNGDTAGHFGGWDGWLYTVNGVEAAVGIDGMQLADGDSILLYYGDPYGVGMQYPVADTADISKGIIRFTSSDTKYDADYNATVTVNPVVGATVTWSNGDVTADYTTDDNGEISIDKDLLTQGDHAVQISKFSDAGIPLVLRYAPDYTVNVSEVVPADNTAGDEDAALAVADTDSETAVKEDTGSLPKTGDDGTMVAVILGIAAAGALTGAVYLRRKGLYEK